MSGAARIGGRVGLSLLFAMALALSPANQAAATCAGEETLFVHALNADGTIFNGAYGSSNVIPVRDRDLSTCFGVGPWEPEAHSTAHMEDYSESHFAEVGWVEQINQITKYWWVFYEGNDGTAPINQYTWGGFGTGPNLNAPPDGGAYTAKWWLNNVDGSTKWHVFVDWNMNGSSDWSKTSPEMNFSHGRAFGETGRRGGVGTGAKDHQWNLRFQKKDDSWAAWVGNGHPEDSICNWNWDRIDTDEYQTVKVSNTC